MLILNLRTRFLLSILGVSVVAVMLISVSSLWVLNTVSTKALTKNAEQNLVSKLANTSDALDAYFSFIDTQIKNKASDPNWIAASHSFVKAFESYS